MTIAKLFKFGVEVRLERLNPVQIPFKPRGPRSHGAGTPPHLWAISSGYHAWSRVARSSGDDLASSRPGDAALFRRASRAPGDQGRVAPACVGGDACHR